VRIKLCNTGSNCGRNDKCSLHTSCSIEPAVMYKALEVHLQIFLTFGTKLRRVSGSSYNNVYFTELQKTRTVPSLYTGRHR
jgi:hypothetical protein